MCDDIKNISIPNSVRIIGDFAFYDCYGLKSLTLPTNLESIGVRAFYRCNKISSINIPASVTNIGRSAFSNCSSLSSIYITDLGAWCNITFAPSEHVGENDKPLGISYNLYLNGEKLTNMVIPEGVTKINACAFSGCVSLTQVTIPEGVTQIEPNTFAQCTSLTGISLPESLTSIGDCAFENCSSLASVSLPDAVTLIGDSVFDSCRGLQSVELSENLTHMGEHAFQYCTSLRSITIHDQLHAVPEYAFRECTSLLSVTLGDGVYEIGQHAFETCTQLRCVVIDEKLCYVGDDAFDDCSGMWHVLHKGTEAQWETLTFDDGNGSIRWVTRHHGCSGSEITDLDNKLCQLCCLHRFDEILVVAPTCGEQGYTLHTCTKCGYNYKDTYVDATGLHSYGAVEVVAPTCTQQGYTSYCCAGCQDSYVGDYVAALGHTADEAVRENEVAATCGTVGSYDSVIYCAVCETELSREPVAVPATGAHVYIAEMERVEPTCTEDGYVIKACDCGSTDTAVLPAIGHSYAETVTAPTCTEQGYTSYVCGVCEHSYVGNYVDALGHSYTDTVVELTPETDGYTLHTCTVCGHSYKDSFRVYVNGTVSGQEEDMGLPATVIITDSTTGEILGTLELTVGESYQFAVSGPKTYSITVRREGKTDVVAYVDVNDCSVTKDIQLYIPGDVDNNGIVNTDDAIYLLYNVMFGDEDYPMNQDCDFDGNGTVNTDDAIYLLYHVMFGEEDYPLHT